MHTMKQTAPLLRSTGLLPRGTWQALLSWSYLLLFTLIVASTARAADFSVREHGATGDGTTLDTAALQRAIEACGKAGGGRVVFPPGKYLSGTLHMRSGVELHLEKDARLIGTTNLAAYAGFSPESKKLDLPTSRQDRALIIGEQVKGIAFTGEGVIDGNKVFDQQGEEKMRGPHTILLGHCEGVTLRCLTIHESANYAFLIYGCDKVRVEDATFEGGWDGVHFRGWPEKWNHDLRLTGCRFFTGDDSIAGNYVEDAGIERCVINSSCNGVRLIGPARRLTFTHCEFFGPGHFPHRTSDRTNMLAALCLQPSAWGKEEGPMEDVSARDCTMRDVACAFHIVTKPGNTAQRLTFERIKATGIYRAAASVESWAERTFRDVVFRDVSLEYTGGGTAEDAAKPVHPPGFDARKLPAWGFYHRNTEDILLDRVTLTLRAPDARPALRSDDAPAPRLIEFSAPK